MSWWWAYLSWFCFQGKYFKTFIIKQNVLHVLQHFVVFFNLQKRFLHEKALSFRKYFSSFIVISLWFLINIIFINIFSNVNITCMWQKLYIYNYIAIYIDFKYIYTYLHFIYYILFRNFASRHMHDIEL